MSQFDAMFYPRAVAVSGSMGNGKLGAIIVSRLKEGGFERIYAVNPKGQGLGNINGYTSVGDIPDTVDMIVVASPAAVTASVLEDAGKAGVHAAVIISSGFGEAGHHDLEEAVSRVTKQYGIRYIGPNCAGMVNTRHSLLATLEAAPTVGRVSLISQSGAVGGMIMAASAATGLGISKFLSYGNGADLSEIELLEYLADDVDTDVIAMYLENVRRGRDFMLTLAKAAAKKPVVIIKSGRSESGRRAALSHTGSLAGADAVYSAAFAKCGAVRVDSIEELLDVCKGFVNAKKPLGKRVAIITNSGGPGVMTIDKCSALNLQTPALSDELKKKLSEFLPAHAGLSNPIDLTVEGTAEDYARAVEYSLSEYDAAIVIYVGTPYLSAAPVASAVISAAAKSGKCVLSAFEIGDDIDEALALLDGGAPSFISGERAANVLSRMYSHTGKCGRFDVPAEKREMRSTVMLEPDVMCMLEDAGISVPNRRFAKTQQEALEAAARIGYPVCMKVVSPSIIHKSDVGGVKLGICSADSVNLAFLELSRVGGKDFRGVMVYPMLKKGQELIMGLNRDPQFGPVIAFGMGGIYAEALKDVAIRVAPLCDDEALEMIQSVNAYKLLQGFRGESKKDIDSLKSMLVKLSELMFMYDTMAEVDLNPVFAYESGAVAADARIILSK